MREPRPTRRSWERRHRISKLLRDALKLSQQESGTDVEDRHMIAFTVRLGLLLEDGVELEEKALERRRRHDRDRSEE